MSKFNLKPIGTKTINRAGGVAYKQTPELELVSLLLTSFVNDKYYESASSQIERLDNLVQNIPDKMFLAQSAVYARKEFGMRSITHILAANIAKYVKLPWVRRAIDKIIVRPDDVLEIISYYLKTFGRSNGSKFRGIPKSLKKGSSDALNRFSAESLMKYKGLHTKELKLRDVFNLVHPRPRNSVIAKMFKDFVRGELKAANTWEVEMVRVGIKAGEEGKTVEEKEKEKSKAWRDLVLEGKVKYFALLRNLRNLNKADIDGELTKAVVKQLTDKHAIKSSLVLPFRFTTAMSALKDVNVDRKIIGALEDAMEISLDNVPKFSGKTLIALDQSGSMGGRPRQIGSLFAAVLAKVNDDSDMMCFADNARYVSINPRSTLSDIQNSFGYESGGTNFSSIFEKANKKYDRVIILSDMQGWVEDTDYYHNKPLKLTFKDYCIKYDVNPHVYNFDLQGYGDMKFPQDKVYCISGFSDKIFDVMKVLEEDKNALINKIKQIVI